MRIHYIITLCFYVTTICVLVDQSETSKFEPENAAVLVWYLGQILNNQTIKYAVAHRCNERIPVTRFLRVCLGARQTDTYVSCMGWKKARRTFHPN